MLTHVMSDLHFEQMRKDFGDRFYENFEELQRKSPAPLLILAGDICQMARHELFLAMNLDRIAKCYEHVIYVPGNHEYYESNFYEVDRFLEELENRPDLENLTVLRSGTVHTWNGQKFLGGTMWFPDGIAPHWAKKGLNDFYVIKGFEPEVYIRNRQFIDFYRSHITNDTVVITHHSCSEKSIPERFRNSHWNPFFVCDMEPYMDETTAPKLWIHGHTHNPFDYTIQNGNTTTRVYCNPHGYPREDANPGFWSRVAIEIPER